MTLLIIVALLTAAEWNWVKERYFEATLESCRSWHRVATVRWKSIPAFDAQVRQIIAETGPEQAMVECTTRWAGPVMGRAASPREFPWPKGALEVSIEGSIYNPPQRILDVSYVAVGSELR